MANKRVSELVGISATDLSTGDLLLLADVTANESKKLTVGNLRTFLASTYNSGTFYGTSSWADKASWAATVPQQDTASYSYTSSFAWQGHTSSYAMDALSASYSLSCSKAITASYAITSAVQLVISSGFSSYSNTSSYIKYTGIPNGTASFAISSSYASSASFANIVTSSYSDTASVAITASKAATSSFVSYNGIPNGIVYSSITSNTSITSQYATNAGYADRAGIANIGVASQVSASWASRSLSSSYSDIAFSAKTASYVSPSLYISNGIFKAITQSFSSSSIDIVSISAGTKTTASINAVGTIRAPWTASEMLSESVTLNLLNRTTGINYVLDMAPIFIFNGGSSDFSGSTKIPVSLMGSYPVGSFDYMLYLSASNNIMFDNIRTSSFEINLNIGTFTVSKGDELYLKTDDLLDIIGFYTLGGVGPFANTAKNIVNLYGADQVELIDLTYASTIHNVWSLSNCTTVQLSNNAILTDVGGMPSSMLTMSLVTSSIASLYDLDHTLAET